MDGCYLINGDCSNDGFDYFRGWLIAQGEAMFERALADPDTLADVVELSSDSVELADLELEDMLGVAYYAYEKNTGQELPEVAWDGPRHPDEPAGKRWDEDDDAGYFARLPWLAAMFMGELGG